MKQLARLFGTSLVLALLALATAAGADAQDVRSRETNRLTRADLAEMNTTDALDAVRSLRPNWLNQRGQGSFRGGVPVRVYIDGVPRGTAEALRAVPLHTIASIQYLGSREATQRWGTDHASGVIMVRTM